MVRAAELVMAALVAVLVGFSLPGMTHRTLARFRLRRLNVGVWRGRWRNP
jgi:hypothetical protein